MKKPAKKRATSSPRQNSNSREAILAAALKSFARDGFDGASLPKIARMARVGHTLIHYHFGSKSKLWRETVDHSLGELRRETVAISNATRTLAPLDRLRALLQAFTAFAARCPDHFGMILAEARSESDRFAWLQKNYTRPFLEDVKSALQDAKDKSQIVDVDVDHLSFMLMGGILLYFSVNPGLPKKMDLNQLVDEHMELMFKMLMTGLLKTRKSPS